MGQRLEAITLNTVAENSDGIWTETLTENYLKLRLMGRHEPNHWVGVEITSVNQGQLVGTKS
jgi:hypothetical protein